MNMDIVIDKRRIGLHFPTYFIVDIAANHDGDLQRAKDLIYLAAEAGADAAKFQHFTASTIVSDYGFRSLGRQMSHQSKWNKSVYQVYADASLDVEWTPILKETCDKVGITFLTSPYSLELVDAVDPFVPAYKIGSGDITWHEIIDHMARKKKPLLLATGAATLEEIVAAVNVARVHNKMIVLMQCNTNYTGSLENYRFVNLNVLKKYASLFPELVLGLSDHTPGHATVLGAIALGARVIEKHFTDDTGRVGPDHGFSMDPASWKEMVLRARELESALGDGVKKVEDNEKDTMVLQRRSLRTKVELRAGTRLERRHMEPLRPCPIDAIPPYRLDEVLEKELARDLKMGEHLKWSDLK